MKKFSWKLKKIFWRLNKWTKPKQEETYEEWADKQW